MEIPVYGPVVDDHTRCVHYRTSVDVVAIRFHCCDRYYPCHLCHSETETHSATQWPVAERSARAVLCGVCRYELTITEYLGVTACPACAAPFNERCSLHAHLYFERD
jgi:uncharacterized CHY-type Zn-finger protein